MESIIEKEAGNLPKLCDSQSERLSSSSSSVLELQAIQDLCSAHKRVSREDRESRAEGKSGHSFLDPLSRQLSDKLVKLDLLSNEQHRVSVIARTPSRQPATSTPSSSPVAPPVPPRSCQSVGQVEEQKTHSETCSDLSSINSEEVFESENVSKVPIPGSSVFTTIMGSNPVCHVVGSMIPEEEDIFTSEDALYYRMRWVGPAEVATMIDSFDQKMKDFEKDYFDLCKSVSRLLRTRAGTLVASIFDAL